MSTPRASKKKAKAPPREAPPSPSVPAPQIVDEQFRAGRSVKEIMALLSAEHGLTKKEADKLVKASDSYKIRQGWAAAGGIGVITMAAAILSLFVPFIAALIQLPSVVVGAVIFFLYWKGRKSFRFSFLAAILVSFLVSTIIYIGTIAAVPSANVGPVIARLLFLYFLYTGTMALRRANRKDGRPASWGRGVLIGIGLIVLDIAVYVAWNVGLLLTGLEPL